MTPQALNRLAKAVQHNCHVSDARHGADYSLCVYLMKMREYYRWERRLPYGAALAKDAVGDWLQARERLWESLEGADMRPLPIDGRDYDPFEPDAINQALSPHGLVYSSGLADQAKAHFFLGDLERRSASGDRIVYVSSSEHARDLAAPPAMTLGGSIFVRRESLRRMLWEKLESWRWSRPDNALGRAFACYDFDGDLEGALDAMTEHEMDNALLHELGEYQAGIVLDDAAWGAMLLDITQTPAERFARAVRDHLADCLVTIPSLCQRDDAPALHFYVGNLSPIRKTLFPGLPDAYAAWRRSSSTAELLTLAERGRGHWQQLGEEIIARHRQSGAAAAPEIRALIEGQPLCT